MSTPAVVLLVQSPGDDGLDMYAEFLRFHGLTVLAVSAVEAALGLTRQADIVVTGIRFPGQMDGLDLVVAIRRDDRTRALPVVVLSSCATVTDRERATSSGADLFIAKPCLPDDLLRGVRRLLSASTLRRIRPAPIKAARPVEASKKRQG